MLTEVGLDRIMDCWVGSDVTATHGGHEESLSVLRAGRKEMMANMRAIQ